VPEVARAGRIDRRKIMSGQEPGSLIVRITGLLLGQRQCISIVLWSLVSHVLGYSNERPKVRIWYGPFKLRFRMIDAIDYYEENGSTIFFLSGVLDIFIDLP
jgi:hypothetical protein